MDLSFARCDAHPYLRVDGFFSVFASRYVKERVPSLLLDAVEEVVNTTSEK